MQFVPNKLSSKLASFIIASCNFEGTNNLTQHILKTLHYDNKTIKETLILVNEFNTPLTLNRYELKKFINRVSKELIFDYIDLKKSFLKFNNETLEDINIIEKNIRDILDKKEPLTIKDLNINGSMLSKELKLKPGKEIGLILNYLLDKVLQNPKLNIYDTLINIAKNKYIT